MYYIIIHLSASLSPPPAGMRRRGAVHGGTPFVIPVSGNKNTPPDQRTGEISLNKYQTRGLRAVSAAGLRGKGSRKRIICLRHVAGTSSASNAPGSSPEAPQDVADAESGRTRLEGREPPGSPPSVLREDARGPQAQNHANPGTTFEIRKTYVWMLRPNRNCTCRVVAFQT